MRRLFSGIIRFFQTAFKSRSDLAIENLVLRQQVAVLKAEKPRPKLTSMDRAFWVLLRRFWPKWSEVLAIVQPETVTRWHRSGFRLFWRWKSRKKSGRPRVDNEIRRLVLQISSENPTWGAPRVHAELLKLGFDVSERTVSRHMPKRPTSPDALERWMTFLRNHQDGIVAMDFFVVPTVTFRLLYVLVFLHHARRRIVHFAVTDSPNSQWVVQQLREAFPFDEAPKHLIFDRDSKFSREVVDAIKAMGIKPVRTSYRSPWQNGTVERWLFSARVEMLDYVVVFNERHLNGLLKSYLAYHHNDRCHLGLEKDSPVPRPVMKKPREGGSVVTLPRVGGLHHRYEWRKAA